MRKVALITGVTGQDGSYLSEFLLEKGYEVHGTIRRSSVDFRERIAHLEGQPNFHLHYADLGDSMSILGVINKVRPTEIYNLAAQSHVQVSFDSPEFTADVDATGVLRVLEAVRQCGLADSCKIYQASTSELYGKVEEVPQNENTPFHPYSPYAVAKLYGFWIVKEYREAYNMYCCSGILFNHESERRGETFVTRKITLAAARHADYAVGIEIVAPAIENAKLNAKANGLSGNTRFICADAAEGLKKVCSEYQVDTLLADPPRSGMDDAMIEAVLNSEIHKIIYVSCNPATLGKNIKALKQEFDVRTVIPYDMFPNTPLIEAVAVLERRGKPKEKK